MTWLNTIQLGQVAMILAILSSAYVALQKLHHIIAPIVDLLEELVGTKGRFGVPPKPGLIERMITLEAAVAQLTAQISRLEDSLSESRKNER